ncbi:MAG: TIGR01244 family phosphatase [Sphingomonadales bacterium]|nr:TIGR01244 family phosphatase [Sphingomonadales bacterium]NCQ19908.1 TIGR01244 family phosphatase [Sphingomonadales bacterium]NCT04992.1 TIGR01244 family phosphatase [Sphingomonadales bacterium]
MDLKVVDDGLVVAAQMQPEDLAGLAEHGFVAVMCNRPDGEEPGQPPLDAMRDAAQHAGLAFHHVPVSGGVFPPAAIAAFGAVRRGTQGKLLAYCRTGTRSVTLDALANVHGLAVSERLSRASAAGYDLSAMAERLEADG